MAMVTCGLNAKRFAGKPLKQPTYSFQAIPRCNKDLEYSSLQEVSDRSHLNEAMSEMVLLCNETMRRLHVERKVGKRTAKPLSLEYIADRLDIDEPIFGFLVRTEKCPPNVSETSWKRGMLQGFITVTTFTNWQKTFRWDSMHDSAFAYDDEALAQDMQSGKRIYDEDGSLAAELQKTVRCGDPWNEGIVWPRIAEISLLGAMGCGKALVSMVIEKLERMKPSTKQNYDYVALQATENSIPFYESLGFVRVGGVTEDEKYEEKQAKLRGEKRKKRDSAGSDATPQPEIVSSSVEVYVTKVAGETPADVAKKLNVDVWDILFLNHYMYPDIATKSRLMKGTSLYVPVIEDEDEEEASSSQPEAPQWYIAEENDTPQMIARMHNVDCAELVRANQSRLPELRWQSRLKEGTRIKVSHFHIDDDKHVPYCHWSFPDDTFETSEPSYMMVRKLNRQKSSIAARNRPVEHSLAVPVSKFSPPPKELFSEAPVLPLPSTKKKPPKPKSSKKKKQKKEFPTTHPKKPKRPPNAFVLFCAEQRELLKEEFEGKSTPEVVKEISNLWKELPEDEKAPFLDAFAEEQNRYRKAMDKYKKELANFHKAHPELESSDEEDEEDDDDGDDTPHSLINKVVKLKGDQEREHEYYFVLTYIPDLCWAHLAPLECVGRWGPDKPKAKGRPIWMLVDESEGKEVDISGSFCIPVQSRAMKGTADADCEQWDILESDDDPSRASRLARKIRPRVLDTGAKRPKSAKKTQSSGKKNRGRPRKYPVSDSSSEFASPKRRGRPPKNQRSATKPLSGSLQPKKRIRGAPEGGFPSPLTGFVKPKRRRPKNNPMANPNVLSEAHVSAIFASVSSSAQKPPPPQLAYKVITGAVDKSGVKQQVTPPQLNYKEGLYILCDKCPSHLRALAEGVQQFAPANSFRWNLSGARKKGAMLVRSCNARNMGGAKIYGKTGAVYTMIVNGREDLTYRLLHIHSSSQLGPTTEPIVSILEGTGIPSPLVASTSAKRNDHDSGDDDDWEEDVPEEPKRRCFSATKPLSGSIERKKRKRRASKDSVKNVSADDSRPTKRRKLPSRSTATASGSYQDVEHSDVDMDESPVESTPQKRRPRRNASDSTPTNPFRSVALTRSARKVKISLTSPLMMRRARVEG